MLVTIIHSINYYSAEYLHHNDLGMTDASCQTDTIGTRNEVDDAKTDVMIQTALTKRTIEAMEEELQRQEEIIKELKIKASTPFDKDFFMSDDDRVLYYTGLPYFTTLSALIKVLDQAIPSSHSFTSFQQVVLCLMRMRLNIPYQDLSQRLGVPRSTVSRTCLSLLDVMHAKLSPLIHWPDRAEIEETTPMCFRKHYGTKITVIIDCFEVFIERPSNLKARAQTWSTYKHHNTVKYLIGVTPQGSVCFISEGYGGRASDKYVTEQCGFLKHLLHGDTVMADRGFSIGESVGSMGANVEMLHLQKGKHNSALRMLKDPENCLMLESTLRELLDCCVKSTPS